MSKNAIVILSHHMDADGKLGSETLARVDLAAKLFEQDGFDFIITSGWDYRDDSDIKIGNAVAENLSIRYPIARDKLLTDVNARDTVGDAFFLRKNIISSVGIKTITVVTSNYHSKRADLIFKNFFSPAVLITTVSTKMEFLNQEELYLHEEKSCLAFNKTFDDVDILNDSEVCHALTRKHPFYNGEIYEKYMLCS